MRCPNTNWNVSTQQKLVLFTDETNPVRVRVRVRIRVRVRVRAILSYRHEG